MLLSFTNFLRRVCQLLKFWVRKHFAIDFRDDVELRESLLTFLDTTVRLTFASMAEGMKTLIMKQFNGEFNTPNAPTEAPESILPKKITNLSILDIHPLEMARQITLMESEAFRKIFVTELTGEAWCKLDKQTRAPNVTQMINQFNLFSNWVISEIARQATRELKIKVLIQFIEITEACKSINNLNSCMAFVFALGESSIRRLGIWSGVDAQSREKYNALSQIFSFEERYKNLRAHTKSCNLPCLPYLGVYLQDLTYIHYGSDSLESNLINFAKQKLVANVFSDIRMYQVAPHFPFTPVASILNFLANLEDNICYTTIDRARSQKRG